MKKDYRIKKNEEFSSIISQKDTYASKCFVVYCSNKKLQHARVGISVSKKLGNAVVRNKIKRQVRMMIHNILDFDDYSKDIIVIVRASYLDNKFEDNQNDLEKVIKKAIIKEL